MVGNPLSKVDREREALTQLAFHLVEVETSEALAQVVARVTEALFEWDAFHFAEHVSDPCLYRRIYAVDKAGGRRIVLEAQAEPEAYPGIENPETQPVLVNRTRGETDDPSVQLATFGDESQRSASLMFVSVRLGGDVFGVISVQSYTPDRFGESDLALLKAIGDFIAPAMRRVLAERERRDNQDAYRRAIAHAGAIPYERNALTRRLTYMGKGFQAMAGYAAEELTPELWDNMVLESYSLGDMADYAIPEAIERCKKGVQRTWRSEFRIRARDGSERWIADSSINLYDSDNRQVGSLGILEDITEHKRNEHLKETLISLGRRLGAANDSREVARHIADAARELVGWEACCVLPTPEPGECSLDPFFFSVRLGETGEVEEFAVRGQLAEDIPLLAARFAERAEGVVLDGTPDEEASEGEADPTPDSKFASVAAEVLPGGRSLAGAPFRDRDGQTVGHLILLARNTRLATAESLRLIELLANYCASAVARAQAEEAMHRNERQYRQAIEQANAVPYERDFRTRALTLMGEGIERMTGYTAKELTGPKLDSIIQDVRFLGDLVGKTRLQVAALACAGNLEKFRADYRIRARDGSERWIADSSITLFDEEGRATGTLGILQDITDRMRTDALNRVLSGLGPLLNAAATPRDVAMVLVEAAENLIGWDACSLNLLDADTGRVRPVLGIDTTGGRKQEFPEHYIREIQPSANFKRTLEQGGHLILRDPDTPEDRSPPSRTWGDQGRLSLSLLFVPVREKGYRNFGTLSIQSYSPQAYTERDLDVLQTLADHCSGALERARTKQQLRESEQRATLFASLANQLNSATTPAETARIIAEAAQQLLGWDSCNVALYMPDHDKVLDLLNFDTVDNTITEFPANPVEQPVNNLAQRVLVEGGFRLLRTKKEVERGDADSVRFGDHARLSASLLFVPARIGERVVGIVTIQRYALNAYSEEDLETLQALADHCGGGFERILAEQRLVRDRHRIEIFADLGRNLGTATTPDEAGKIIVEAARELIGWDSCFLLLYSEKENHLTPLFAVDLLDGKTIEVPHQELEGEPSGYTEQAIREGGRLVTRTPEHTPPPTLAFGDVKRRSTAMMYVPIHGEGHVIGILSIQTYGRQPYTTADLELLDSLAQHCSGALERINIEQALRESEERYTLAARGANDGLWDWDLETNKVYYSPRFKEMLGHAEDEIGHIPEEWMRRVHPEDAPDLDENLQAHLEGETDNFENEHRLLHREGHFIWVLCRGLGVRDDSGKVVRIAGSMTDISARRASEDQLAQAAFYDSLTGLPNRVLFIERLERCLLRHRRRSDPQFAVFFLDLDRFKKINDTYGHLAGDKLLTGIAQRLAQSVREGDTVARMGGDEFTVLLDDIHDAAEVKRVAERLLSELAKPHVFDGREIRTAGSIGVALGHAGYTRADDILRDADAALYQAKKKGRGTYVFFEGSGHDPALRGDLENRDWRRALDDGEIELLWQPVFAPLEGRLRGFDTLVVWKTLDRDAAQSSEVYPALVEETDSFAVLGEWLLHEIQDAWRRWAGGASGLRDRWSLGLNLSRRQLEAPALAPEAVGRMLAECRERPGDLRFSLAVGGAGGHEEIARLATRLTPWRTLGVRIGISHFGKHRLPLERLAEGAWDFLLLDTSLPGGATKGGGKAVSALANFVLAVGIEPLAHAVVSSSSPPLPAPLRFREAGGLRIALPLTRDEADRLVVALASNSNTDSSPEAHFP